MPEFEFFILRVIGEDEFRKQVSAASSKQWQVVGFSMLAGDQYVALLKRPKKGPSSPFGTNHFADLQDW